MKKTTKYLIAVSSFILSAGLAYADGEECDTPVHKSSSGSPQESMFKSADTNSDGEISKNEFNAYYAQHNKKHFKSLDVNKDGKITANEMQKEQHQMHKQEHGKNDATSHLEQRFKAADTNNDDGLNKEEAKGMPMLTVYFDQVDANKDGKVTRQEYFDAMPLLHRGKQMDSAGNAQAL